MTCSSPDFTAPLVALAPSSDDMFGSAFSFSGEIGMVSSGTGELDLSLVGAVAEADMAGNRKGKAETMNAEGREIRVALRPW